MKCRKQIRKERQVILYAIDKLDESRCELCSFDNGLAEMNKSKCDCEAAVRIRRLGAKLETLLTERKKLYIEIGEVPDTTGVTVDELTKELYRKMKAAKMRDSEIRKIFGVGMVKFTRWKDANGLTIKAMKGE